MRGMRGMREMRRMRRMREKINFIPPASCLLPSAFCSLFPVPSTTKVETRK
jgi:hypothetical protein